MAERKTISKKTRFEVFSCRHRFFQTTNQIQMLNGKTLSEKSVAFATTGEKQKRKR